jgi:uncharacterized protein
MDYTVKRMYPSGEYVNLLKPFDTKVLSIEDIAWSLSMQCRFGGCCERHYSVAEHSILVVALSPTELGLEALLHDAHEAYVQDMNTGTKKAIGPAWATLEHTWASRVRVEYGISLKDYPEVKHADRVALATERRDLGLLDDTDWPTLRGITADSGTIPRLSQQDAYKLFIRMFCELHEARK